jgi:hypothetical protein
MINRVSRNSADADKSTVRPGRFRVASPVLIRVELIDGKAISEESVVLRKGVRAIDEM